MNSLLDELDICAAFEVADGISGTDLTEAVRAVAGDSFIRSLNTADDDDQWFLIGRAPREKHGHCIVLGDNGYISNGESYTRIMVCYAPLAAPSSVSYGPACTDFPGAVLESVRAFRDELHAYIVRPKEEKKGMKKK